MLGGGAAVDPWLAFGIGVGVGGLLVYSQLDGDGGGVYDRPGRPGRPSSPPESDTSVAAAAAATLRTPDRPTWGSTAETWTPPVRRRAGSVAKAGGAVVVRVGSAAALKINAVSAAPRRPPAIPRHAPLIRHTHEPCPGRSGGPKQLSRC